MIDPARALDRTVPLMQDYVDAPDEMVIEALIATRVLLRVDETTLACDAGVTALLACFQTAARLGAHISLDIPDHLEANLAPLGRKTRVTDVLAETADQLIFPLEATNDPNLTFALGEYVEPGDFALGGDGFGSRLRVSQPAGSWSGHAPFGGALAGVAAGAEVARFALARLIEDGHPPREPVPLTADDHDLRLPDLPLPPRIDLGEVDFVSAGAITHAVLFLLFRLAGVELTGRVFDDDRTEVENLNRYLLLTNTGLEIEKVEQLGQFQTNAIRLHPEPVRVTDTLEATLADRVCVGADSVEARWITQRLAHGWVGVGATTHTLAMASEHWPGTPCAGCLHPTGEPPATRLPTASFVSLLAGTILAHRLVASVVASQQLAEATIALSALNLAGTEPIVTHPVAHTPACPVGHQAAAA